jgi:3-hydroxyisobutyryl-CoA hydrolase
VLFEQLSPSVVEWKLNSPKSMNSVDTEMCELMISELKKWKNIPTSRPRVMMMTGTGGKAFCAGGDIVSLYKAHVTEGADKSCLREFFAKEYLLDYTLSAMRNTRQIAIWNGICMGGGVGLTWHSPIRVATDNSMYAMPETAIGFFTDVGGSYFLSRVKNDISLGLYLGLSGQRVKSRDLVKWGIATHFIEQAKIPEL